MEDKPQSLIVEDDAFIADIMLNRFEPTFDVRRVETIGAAREILERYPIQVLFLDIHLPDESGIDFLQELNASGKLSELVVIVLSNESNEDEIEACLAAGAKKYYVKAMANFGEIAEEALALVQQ